MLEPALAELQSNPAAAEAAAEAFQQLKPVCSQLLHYRNDPQALAGALRVLQGILEGTRPAGLQRCFDYVTYPLLFMLDAAVASRGAPATLSGGSSSSSGASARQQPTIPVPAMQQDAAAEALLQCVLVLMQCCQGLEADQLMPVLQHVGCMLQLPRENVPEEMRLKCFQIISAALQSQQQLPRQQQLLQHPAGGMLAGFLLTTCLAAADAEVAAGPQGSKAVRQAAIRALTAVMQGLGPGPQLAFALPGLSSGLAKQLLASAPLTAGGASVTGAAAGSTGTVLVLRALALIIQLVLGDAAVADIPSQPAAASQQQPGPNPALVATAADALDLLQQLSVRTSSAAAATGAAGLEAHSDHPTSSTSSTNGLSTDSQGGGGGAGHNGPQQQQQQGSAAQPPPVSPLTANRDAAWLATCSSKVQTLLAMVLPRLMSHAQPAVRQALAEVTAGLLQHCSRSLHNSSVALTEILLTLANDDYTQVAQPAIAWLQAAGSTAGGVHAAGQNGTPGQPPAAPLQLGTVAARLRKAAAGGAEGSVSTQVQPAVTTTAAAQSTAPPLSDLLLGLCLQLPASMRQSEASGTAAAKRTAAALLCAGSPLVSSTLLSKGPVLQQVCFALVSTFQIDPTGAAILLRANTAVLGELPADDNDAAGAAAAAWPDRPGGASTSHVAGRSAGGYPLLPRMPLSLQYLISSESYKAAAGAVRALGRAARLADHQQEQQHKQQQSASSNDLAALVQQLLDQIQAASSPHKPQQQGAYASPAAGSAGAGGGPVPAAGQWQCNTAAAVVVLTEVLFGASGAWKPPHAATAGRNASSIAAASAQEELSSQHSSGMDAAYEAVLLQAVTALVRPKLWGLPTAQPVGNSAGVSSTNAGSSERKIPAQVLGANALLLRCLIDCIGAVARCAGPAFSTGSSKLLRTALLPLLERLADPCPLVSTAAAGALDSICRHTGYPSGLQQLVGANADYVVEGVCRQLRSLQQHPRAPQLLAALLREAGVSAALMPLLAEPLRAALSGLSILARQQQPGYVLPFLYVLQSVSNGADQEAQHSRQVIATQLQASAEEARTAGLTDADVDSMEASDDDDADVDSSLQQRNRVDAAAGAEESSAGASGGSAAARYFKQRLKKNAAEDPGSKAAPSSTRAQQQRTQQQRQSGQHGDEGGPPAHTTHANATPATNPAHLDVPVLPSSKRLHLPPPQLEELELAWRRAHSAGSLAAAAVDAATPLLLQRNLRCAVLAVQVLAGGLQALAAATEAIDAEEQLFERLVDRGPDAALKPTRPTPAKLLPAVHGVWPMLLAALQDTGSVALLEQQLSLLAQLIQLAGGKFMAKRFRQAAWPLLCRLLKSGPQAGAAALAAATAADTVGGRASTAALLGVGAGPGSDGRQALDHQLQASGPAGSITGALSVTAVNTGGGGMTSSSSVFGSALSSMQASAGTHSMAAAGMSRAGAQEEADDEGASGPLAPATLQRVQLAVLGCLQSICSSRRAAPALQGPLVWDACVLAAPFLADSQALALREAAAKLLVAAADVDADAVWLLLVDLGSCFQDITQLLPAACLEPSAPACEQQAGLGGELHLPLLQQLLRPVDRRQAQSGGGDAGLVKLLRSGDAGACGRRAAALLPRVAAAPVGWHEKARQQLAVLQQGAC